MMMTQLIRYLLLIALTTGLIGCLKVDNFSTEEWRPRVALPLMHTSVGLLDFLEEIDSIGSLEIAPDNSIMLVYESDLFSQPSIEAIEIPGFSIPLLDTNFVVPPDILSLPFRLDRAMLKETELAFHFEALLDEDVKVSVWVSGIKSNGNPLAFSFNLLNQGSAPSIKSGTLDVAGYELDFTEEFRVRYEAVGQSGNHYFLPVANIGFETIDYQYIEGNFGTLDFTLPSDSILIDFFDSSLRGNFSLQDPRFILTFQNSLGIPLEVTALSLLAHTEKKNILRINSPLDNGFIFDYPSMEQIGQTVETSLSINSSNSNISEIIGALPKRIDFQFEVTGFPDSDSTSTGFLQDNSSFSTAMKMELPLNGTANNLTYETVTEIENQDIEEADSVIFRVVAENGFPLDLDLQLYFEDSQGMLLDSLLPFPSRIAVAAPVDQSGRVTKSTGWTIDLPVGSDKLDVLKATEQIRLLTSVSSLNGGTTPVQIFTDYYLNLRLGAEVILNLEN